MLTLTEIQSAAINPDVAREAHTQTQKRLEDALATKASHEQKAFALLAAYITVALALFTVFGVFATGSNEAIAPAFFLTGFIYTIGAGLSGIALLPQTYGALGSDPSAWLRHGVIDGNEAALPASLAYEVFFHHERIAASDKANRSKAHLVRAAILCGLGSPVVLSVWIWLSA
jgi:hypothetical protein